MQTPETAAANVLQFPARLKSDVVPQAVGNAAAIPCPAPGGNGEAAADAGFQERERRELAQQAASLVARMVALSAASGAGQSFRAFEDALADALNEVGRTAVRGELEEFAGNEPEVVIVDGKAHRKVINGGPGQGSAQICTPYGVVSVGRALYREQGTRGVAGAETIGLLEKRAGIIEGMTPRMAEIVTAYDAAVPSREAEKLMDLAGLRGPRRATLERKAGLVGNRLLENIEGLLRQARTAERLPEGAAMITIGMDRVNLAYEEPNPGGQKSERTRRLRAQRPYERPEPEPISRVFHGDFVGSVTIRDDDGELLRTYCYGLSHEEDPARLADWLLADVVSATQQKAEILVSVCQDGARELWPVIWNAVKRQRRQLKGVRIRAAVDFYHFSPRAETLVGVLWEPGSWPSWKARLLDEPRAVFALEQAAVEEFERRQHAGILTDEQTEAVHGFLTYIEERSPKRSRMWKRDSLFDYANLRRRSLPIGSGPVEATAKSVVTVRMKRCGHRWSVEGARATLTSRSLRLSGERWKLVWQRFEASHLAAEITPLVIA